MDRPPRTPVAGLLGIVLVGALTACGDAPPPDAATSTITLPGERVFPEGVAYQEATGDFFVGSTSDGTIYRGTVRGGNGAAEVFLPGGADGREAVTGMKVDEQGRLFVAGRGTGRAFVYDTGTGELLKALGTPAAERTLINDVAVTPDAAYFTDSFRPVLFRAPLTADAVGDLEPWLDLTGTPIEYGSGFNLNGIVATPDGRYLLTVHSSTGALYRIGTADRTVSAVDLGDAALPGGDGLVLDGQTLYAVSGPGIVPVELSQDLTAGEVGSPFTDPSLRYPTTIAGPYDDDGERLLVVNSQLDMTGEGATPDLPFSVSSVPIP